MEQLKRFNPHQHIRLANPNELLFIKWYAEETQDKRLLDRVNDRHNYIMKYDY